MKNPRPEHRLHAGSAAGLSDSAKAAVALKARALRWLAQREHSSEELARKLRAHLQRRARAEVAAAHAAEAALAAAAETQPTQTLSVREQLAERAAAEAAQVQAVLEQLRSAGLLSDERAAASVLNAQAARSGRRRLQQLLQAKGLPEALVQGTLAQARETEFDRAWALWQRRYGEVPREASERARQQRYLISRGFDFDIVARVLRQAGDRSGCAFEAQEAAPDS